MLSVSLAGLSWQIFQKGDLGKLWSVLRVRQLTGGERPVTCLRALAALITFITFITCADVHPGNPGGDSSGDFGDGVHDV